MLLLVLSFLLLLLFLIRSFPFCLSFFHSSLVVLAVTTTRFSFFSIFLYLFFSVYTNVVSYQQIYCSTDWLLQRWTNISRHCTEREKERNKKTTATLSSDTKARSLWCSLSLWLFYYRHRVYFSFLIIFFFLFSLLRTGQVLPIDRSE